MHNSKHNWLKPIFWSTHVRRRLYTAVTTLSSYRFTRPSWHTSACHRQMSKVHELLFIFIIISVV